MKVLVIGHCWSWKTGLNGDIEGRVSRIKILILWPTGRRGDISSTTSRPLYYRYRIRVYGNRTNWTITNILAVSFGCNSVPLIGSFSVALAFPLPNPVPWAEPLTLDMRSETASKFIMVQGVQLGRDGNKQKIWCRHRPKCLTKWGHRQKW